METACRRGDRALGFALVSSMHNQSSSCVCRPARSQLFARRALEPLLREQVAIAASQVHVGLVVADRGAEYASILRGRMGLGRWVGLVEDPELVDIGRSDHCSWLYSELFKAPIDQVDFLQSVVQVFPVSESG